MTARRPSPDPIQGRFLRLEPFTPEHLPGLRTALWRPEVFAGGYGGGPAGLPADEDAFDAWCAAYGSAQDGIKYVARLTGGPHDGEIVGASSLLDLHEASESTHIGSTGWDPRVWGTQVNPEAKLLMLGTAFAHGYGRVKLQADERNARSRAAILKLGASFEGITRRHVRRADGSWRDSAVFSITIDDWPAVRAGLERRLAAWDDRPVLYRSVPHPPG